MNGILAALFLLLCLYPKTGLYDQGYTPAGLAEGAVGSLYGGDSAGGPNSVSSRSIFEVSKAGTGFQVLQTFCTSCTTGAQCPCLGSVAGTRACLRWACSG